MGKCIEWKCDNCDYDPTQNIGVSRGALGFLFFLLLIVNAGMAAMFILEGFPESNDLLYGCAGLFIGTVVVGFAWRRHQGSSASDLESLPHL